MAWPDAGAAAAAAAGVHHTPCSIVFPAVLYDKYKAEHAWRVLQCPIANMTPT
jgi:hypothetical protein